MGRKEDMKKHATKIIVNPNANLGHAWRLASDLRLTAQEFGGADWSGTVYPTHAVELARKAVEDGYERIISAGGDGTIHEIINGLMEFPPDQRPQMGVVPLGSGNDLAYALGMDPDPGKALRQIFQGEPRLVDVGLVKDGRGHQEYWVNTLGIGFDGIVTIHAHNMPYLRGTLMYLISVLKTIFLNHHPIQMTFEMDDHEPWTERILMLTLCNGPREGGGFRIAPDAAPGDGLLNWVSVRKVSRPTMFYMIPKFMRGTHLSSSRVKTGTFRSLHIRGDRPLYVHFDGEVLAGFMSNLQEMHVEVIPQAIEFLA
jgi:YegS/Rv2252/BmrU family lipid kinase